MSKRVYCVNISSTASNEDVWVAIRGVYGPLPSTPLTAGQENLMNSDIDKYNQWVADSGHTTVPFKKWLLWYLTHYTVNYNNLGTNGVVSADKVGHGYSKCPYDTDCDDLRSISMLGFIPTKVSHEVGGTHYYLTTKNRGPRWGKECTFPGCPYFSTNGLPYFYI